MNWAILVAAGRSRRLGFDKLSAPLAGRPVLAHALAAFEACHAVDRIVVVTATDRVAPVRRLAEAEGIRKLDEVVVGGAERMDSVWNGLAHAADRGAEIVAVHDAARPLVRPEVVAAAVALAEKHGAAAVARPVADTLKRADARPVVTGSVDREGLWAMETPQVFRCGLLADAYRAVRAAGDVVTDEVSAVQAVGGEVRLLAGDSPNLKITWPTDLALAEALLALRGAADGEA